MGSHHVLLSRPSPNHLALGAELSRQNLAHADLAHADLAHAVALASCSVVSRLAYGFGWNPTHLALGAEKNISAAGGKVASDPKSGIELLILRSQAAKVRFLPPACA